MAEGFIDDRGVFHSYEDCIDLVIIRAVGHGPESGLTMSVSPLVFATKDIREIVVKHLRSFATKVENFKYGEG